MNEPQRQQTPDFWHRRRQLLPELPKSRARACRIFEGNFRKCRTISTALTGSAPLSRRAHRLPAADTDASDCLWRCLLMAVFYAFVPEPILSGPALVKGLVYALLLWLANAFIMLPSIGKSPLSFDVAEFTFCGFLTISRRGPQ
jgi:hypothetical protein